MSKHQISQEKDTSDLKEVKFRMKYCILFDKCRINPALYEVTWPDRCVCLWIAKIIFEKKCDCMSVWRSRVWNGPISNYSSHCQTAPLYKPENRRSFGGTAQFGGVGVRSVGDGSKFSSRKWQPSILAINFRTTVGANWGPVAKFCQNWGPTGGSYII